MHQFIYEYFGRESWAPFDGFVPRVGETVQFLHRCGGQEFIVTDIKWFIGEGTHSEARIRLKPTPPREGEKGRGK